MRRNTSLSARVGNQSAKPESPHTRRSAQPLGINATDAQVIGEWRRRRAATWRAIRIAMAFVLISGATFWILARTPASDMNGVELIASFLAILVLGINFLVVIFRTNKLYRCPRCNSVPMAEWSSVGPGSIGYEWGLALNPERCSNCGAVLRESR
jgi:ribosomal protein S27AE